MRNSILPVSPVTAVVALLAATLAPSPARGDVFVHRDQILPNGVWAFDLGLGIGHLSEPAPIDDVTGLGFNLELKGSLTPRLQLGVRTGIRVGSDGKATEADRFGRTFETETYGTGADTVANPELSLRYAVVDSPTVDLALDGRVYLPIESHTKVGIMLAVPLAFHLSPTVRFDTGIFVPIIFTDPTQTVISFPFHLWLQANNALALGVITGVAVHNPHSTTTVPLGLALNYGISSDADLRVWFLFPNVKGSGATNYYGVGLGLEARF
jgi:hypothetical protein